MLYGRIGVPLTYNFALGIMTLEGQECSKRTQWLKSVGGSLAAGSYFPRGSDPIFGKKAKNPPHVLYN